MTIEINDPTVQQWIADEIAAGRYLSVEAMIASAVHGLRLSRALGPEQHDEVAINRRRDDLAAFDDEARDANDVFADIRNLRELRSPKPVPTA